MPMGQPVCGEVGTGSEPEKVGGNSPFRRPLIVGVSETNWRWLTEESNPQGFGRLILYFITLLCFRIGDK